MGLVYHMPCRGIVLTLDMVLNFIFVKHLWRSIPLSHSDLERDGIEH